MAAKHGTANRYNQGCRCENCKDSHRLRAAAYRQRRSAGETRPPAVAVSLPVTGESHPSGPGPVESAVEFEVGGLAEARPTLVAVALAMARILDSSRVPSTKPPAAKVLVTVLDTLRKSAQGRRGNLAVVRDMTAKGGAPGA
jgi:hypothetical protein